MINVTATPPALPELHEGSDQTATTYPILVDERVGGGGAIDSLREGRRELLLRRGGVGFGSGGEGITCYIEWSAVIAVFFGGLQQWNAAV
eukprot:scaffold1689_cov123-Alexandrium_tamarense.AAC.1